MRKLLTLLMILTIAFSSQVLVGCGKSADKNASGIDNVSREQIDTPADDKVAQEIPVFPRTYVDAKGVEVVIEKQPERIAVTLFRFLEHWYALDMPPASAADVEDLLTNWMSFRPYADKGSVIELGSPLNLEKLLETEPDLIIASTPHNDEIYGDLQKIAPVVTFNTTSIANDWRAALREFAKIVAKEQSAEEFITQVDTKIATSRDNFKIYQDKTFGFFVINGKDAFGAYTMQTLSTFYDPEKGFGLKAPLGYPEGDGTGHSKEFTLEGLAEMNPDYIIIRSNTVGNKDQQDLEELATSAVWNSLTAVKNDNVYLLDRSAFSGGPLAAEYGVNALIDILEQ